jgi:hypothetical protein
MILILSNEQDFSTNDVIDWLNYYNVDFIRLNGEMLFSETPISIRLNNEGQTVEFFGKKAVFQSIWYRRWFVDTQEKNIIDDLDKINNIKVIRFANNEIMAISRVLFDNLENKSSSINLNYHTVQKARSLKIAQNVGLTIPKTIFTNNKADLLELNERLLIIDIFPK